MGRKHLLTPEMRARICQLARQGATQSVIADDVGIARETLASWLHESRYGDDPRVAGLAEDYARHQSMFGQRMIRSVADKAEAGEGDSWKAASWYLERTRPKEFGNRVMLEGVRENVIDETLRRLRDRLDPGEFAKIVGIIADEESAGSGIGGDGEDGDGSGSQG